MTDQRQEVLKALGLPGGPPRGRRPGRPRIEDGPALCFAALFGFLAGLAIGYEVFPIGVWLILSPGALTMAAALVCGRPALPSVIAAFVSCAIAGLVGIPVLLMRLAGSIWS